MYLVVNWEMFATRAPLLSRALVQFARNGKYLGVAASRNTKQLQLQQKRFGHDWTYRTGIESNPLYKRVWAQACGGCKWIESFSSHNAIIATIIPVFLQLKLENHFICKYFSHVVVDYLAFVLGLGTYCWWISISKCGRMDRCRAWNSTRWYRWIVEIYSTTK